MEGETFKSYVMTFMAERLRGSRAAGGRLRGGRHQVAEEAVTATKARARRV